MSSPEPRQQPAPARNAIPGAFRLVAVMALLGLFFWLRLDPAAWPPPGGRPLLTDPDGAMHLAVLREAQALGRWRIDVLPHDNAPLGRTVEWSAANTTALRLAEVLLGDRWMPVFFAPLLALGAVGAIGALVWRRDPALALAWGTAWVALPSLWDMQRAGNIDHHTLQTAGLALALGGVLAVGASPPRAAAVLSGLGAGIMLWAGAPEALPFISIVGLYGVWRAGAGDSAERAFWRDGWLAGLVVIAVPLLAGDWDRTNLDRLHPVHAAGWLVLGASGAAAGPARARWMGAGALLVAGSLLCLGAAIGFTGSVRGLSVLLHPDFRRHAEQVAEFLPLAPTAGGMLAAWLSQLGLLMGVPLVAWAVGSKALAPEDRRLLALVSLLTIVYLLGTTIGARWIRPGSALVAIGGTWALMRLPWPLRGRGLALAAAIAMPLLLTVLLRVGGHVHRDRSLRCHQVAREAAAVLPPGSRPVILTGLDVAPFLLAEGRAATIGSLYYANVEGLDDQARLFMARSRAEFDPIREARNVAAVLVLGHEDLSNDIARAFVQRGRGTPSVADVQGTIVWRLHADPATPRTELPSGAMLLWLTESHPARP